MKSDLKPTVHSPRLVARICRLWTVGRGLKLVLPVLIAYQLLAPAAFAANDLEVDLTPLGLRARNGAPIPVEARFKWNGTRLLEGRLEMEFHEGNRVLGRYRSGDLALTGGEQTFQMLLPPDLRPFSDSQVEVQMKFVAAGNAIEVQPSSLYVPTAGERALVLGWCDARTADSQPASDLVRNLMFDHFAPPSDDLTQRLLMATTARLTPEDLPAQPLAYTAFDVVVLTADAFKQAHERQLQALARWVKGGGSVCVLVGGGLQPHHVWFLNQLAESAPDGQRFLADDAGNLLPAQKDMICLRPGLGRGVIVTGQNATDLGLNVPACRKAAAFLWKIRAGQALAIAGSGHWNPPEDASVQYYAAGTRRPFPRGASGFAQPLSYSVQPGNLGAELLVRLMPKTVRLIPFSALIGMLALFALLIGPADYYVLGFFRRRRLTWVLFPVTSIAFTVATVLMANHYLGLRDQRCSLFVVDLAKDGTALRWNRYQLVFAARDKQSVTELKDALWAPLDVQAPMPVPGYVLPGGPSIQVIRGQRTLVAPNNPNQPYIPVPPAYNYRTSAGVESEPPLYDGVLPVHFQTSEAIRQWQPKLNRTFSFEPPPVPLLPNWREIEQAWPNLQNIQAKLSAGKSFAGDVCSISGANSVTFGPGFRGILSAAMLEGLCHDNGGGLWTVVSQISPTGGGNFEDEQAMDTETNDAVLVIATRSGDDIVVYRRFFYDN